MSLCLCGLLIVAGSSGARRCAAAGGQGRGRGRGVLLQVAGRAPVIVILAESDTWTTGSARSRGIAAAREGVLASLAPGDFVLGQQWQYVSGFAGELSQARPRAPAGASRRPPHRPRPEGPRLHRGERAHDPRQRGPRPRLHRPRRHGGRARHRHRRPASRSPPRDRGRAVLLRGLLPQRHLAPERPGQRQRRQRPRHQRRRHHRLRGHGWPRWGWRPMRAWWSSASSAPSGGSVSTIVSALEYVLARPHIKVVNMSLGGGGPFTTVCDNVDASTHGLRRRHRPPPRAGHAERRGVRQRRIQHRREQPRLHQRRARRRRRVRPERRRHRLADVPRCHDRLRPGHLLLQQQPPGGAAGPGRADHVVGPRRRAR